MNLTGIDLNFSSLSGAEFDALNFSIIGMAVVFGGLSLIAIYIALLPLILKGFSRVRGKLSKASRRQGTDGQDHDLIDEETLIAIAAALHLHRFGGSDNRKITWKRHGLWDSSWQRAGRFEAMNRQGQIVASRR